MGRNAALLMVKTTFVPPQVMLLCENLQGLTTGMARNVKIKVATAGQAKDSGWRRRGKVMERAMEVMEAAGPHGMASLRMVGHHHLAILEHHRPDILALMDPRLAIMDLHLGIMVDLQAIPIIHRLQATRAMDILPLDHHRRDTLGRHHLVLLLQATLGHHQDHTTVRLLREGHRHLHTMERLLHPSLPKDIKGIMVAALAALRRIITDGTARLPLEAHLQLVVHHLLRPWTIERQRHLPGTTGDLHCHDAVA